MTACFKKNRSCCGSLSVRAVRRATLASFCGLLVLAQGQVTNIAVIEDGLSGGGFQSDVAISQSGQLVISAGDVSGIHLSSDGGKHFSTRNKGLRSIQVASIAITPDNPEILYAATGDKGTTGALNISTDGGRSWSQTAAGNQARFAGNHSADVHTQEEDGPLPSSHPRSNGSLIAIVPGSDPAVSIDDLIVVGTYKNGVKIFTAGGDQLHRTVEDGTFVRSVFHNPNAPGDLVYAAIYSNIPGESGIYKIDLAVLNMPESTLVYPTTEPEDVVVLDNGNVYAAVGKDGLAGDNGSGWQQLNNGLLTSPDGIEKDDLNPLFYRWASITGYVANGQDILYATVNNAGASQGINYSSVWRSDEGGDSWTALVNYGSNVSLKVYGRPPGSQDWWFEKGFGNALLGRKNTAFGNIGVTTGDDLTDPSDDSIYVSGRGGIWKSADGGTSWNPAVQGMRVTANRSIAVNPTDPSQVIVGNTDFVIMESGNRLGAAKRDKPASVIERAYDVIFDGHSNHLLAAVGDRDTNINGEVYVKASSAIGTSPGANWTSLNLSGIADGKIPQAISYGYHDGNASVTDRITIVAVRGSGVYRHDGSTWTKSTGPDITSNSARSRLHWPDPGNSGIVYLLDTSTGLFRSSDSGKTWINIWPEMEFKNNDFFLAGYLAGNTPETLFVSAQGNGPYIGSSFGVFRLENADTASFGDPKPGADKDPKIDNINYHSGNTVIKRPGPIEMGPEGRLWLTEQSNPTNTDASLYVMENPDTDTSFNDLTTPEYEETVIKPIDMAVSTDGVIYISQTGVGAVRILMNPEEDSDNDGASALEEFIAGTDRNNSGSLFHLSNLISTQTGMQGSFPTTDGKFYEIQYSDNLAQWLTLENFTGNGAQKVFVDPVSAQHNKRFYRVVVSD